MRDYLSIKGGKPLKGNVRVSGAKNSALPLLIASLLTPERSVFRNVPQLEDIAVTCRLLRSLGAEIEHGPRVLSITARNLISTEAPYSLVKAMRGSFWVLGPLLARLGSARVALPGGDAIGARPVDLHLKGLMKMGADIRMRHGVVIASAPGGFNPQQIVLDYPSVGATHHLLMTAALVEGETVIEGAAREPEIKELGALLNSMGAEVHGAGSGTITVLGRQELKGGDATILGDRIEGVTYLTAAAMTGGNVRVQGLGEESIASTLELLKKAGCLVTVEEDGLRLAANGRLKALSFETAPYPGIATDVQPLIMAAMCTAEGSSIITEKVFENRFGHVGEYRRFGADITLSGRVAAVNGVSQLSAAPVEATDIRAAAGLVLMGLASEGVTEIHELHHLDRGYDSLIEKFQGLGADIQRVPAFEEKELVIGC